VRGVRGDPTQLGSLGPPLSCGAVHPRHADGEGSPRGACRRTVHCTAGVAQGALHPLQDDLQ
jgi:hypothetical protein